MVMCISLCLIGESDGVTLLSPDIKQIPREGELFGVSLEAFSQSSLSDAPALLLTLHSLSAGQLRAKSFKANYISLSHLKSPSQDGAEFPFVSTSDADLAYNMLKSLIMPNLNLENNDGIDVKAPDSYLAAHIEWGNVDNNSADITTAKSPAKASLINSAQALEYFRSKRMLEYINIIRLPPEARGIRKVFRRLFGPPDLHTSLIHERNLILAMALHPFDNSDCFHTSILDSIYRLLTGSKVSCPRFGSHWEVIGFQGSDPATDLRGAGMLGLVNIFDFVTSPIAYQIALDILKLSKDPVQFFPMCALSMNLTVMTLVFLKDGILARVCNRRGMVFSVVNDVYKALFHRLYTVWKEKRRTIWDSDAVLSELENFARRNISRLLNEFYSALEQLRAGDKKALGSAKSQGDGKPVEFRGLDEIELELSLSTE